jgi:cystathionine gamma-synthase
MRNGAEGAAMAGEDGKDALAPASLLAQSLGWIDPATKAIVPPIHLSSTFLRDEDNQFRSGRVYARADNPTFDQLEATLCALEKGEGAYCFASGMAAATACFLALAPGDHVIAPKVMYWSLRNWLMTFATPGGCRSSSSTRPTPTRSRPR